MSTRQITLRDNTGHWLVLDAEKTALLKRIDTSGAIIMMSYWVDIRVEPGIDGRVLYFNMISGQIFRVYEEDNCLIVALCNNDFREIQFKKYNRENVSIDKTSAT